MLLLTVKIVQLLLRLIFLYYYHGANSTMFFTFIILLMLLLPTLLLLLLHFSLRLVLNFKQCCVHDCPLLWTDCWVFNNRLMTCTYYDITWEAVKPVLQQRPGLKTFWVNMCQKCLGCRGVDKSNRQVVCIMLKSVAWLGLTICMHHGVLLCHPWDDADTPGGFSFLFSFCFFD